MAALSGTSAVLPARAPHTAPQHTAHPPHLRLVDRRPPAPAPAPVKHEHEHDESIRDGGLVLDPAGRTVTVEGAPVELTYLEFELLEHLLEHPHRVFARSQLLDLVWGYPDVGSGRTVDVHIARLRRKLGGPYRRRLVTVHRVGYKYQPAR